MRLPQRHITESHTVDIDGDEYVIPGVELWLVKDDDIWHVWCMDCGIRLGTVDAGEEGEAIRATDNHRKRMHN